MSRGFGPTPARARRLARTGGELGGGCGGRLCPLPLQVSGRSALGLFRLFSFLGPVHSGRFRLLLGLQCRGRLGELLPHSGVLGAERLQLAVNVSVGRREACQLAAVALEWI